MVAKKIDYATIACIQADAGVFRTGVISPLISLDHSTFLLERNDK